MYGINLVQVAKILGTNLAANILFSQQGLIRSILQEIIKYSAQKDIEMVRFMMKTLARQNEKAYRDVIKVLYENFSEQELKDMFGN